MKIHQLPLGARFVYEGEEYVKSGPMVGSGKTGQRLIPKYAVLTPLDGSETAPEVVTVTETLSRAQVLAAFARYHETCLNLVPSAQQSVLIEAAEEFRRCIG